MEKITWKNIFNTDHSNNKRITLWTFGEAWGTATNAHYPYFTWSGWVYNTKSGERTETLVENLK